MKKFIFKMQKVLDFKRRIEEEFIKLLALDTSHLYNANKGLEILYDELSDITDKINEVRNDNYQSDNHTREIMSYYSYSSYLKESIANQKKKIEIIEVTLENDRKKLITAIKERKILEKIKEYKYSTFLDKYVKIDQKETDEFAARISYKHMVL